MTLLWNLLDNNVWDRKFLVIKIIFVYILVYSTKKYSEEGEGGVYTYLETISTKVSWNWRRNV